jgi:hypothetical protein
MIIIYNPSKKYSFELAKHDLPEKLSWINAREFCQNNSENWRLPTLEELKVIYDYSALNKDLSLTKDDYWSGDLVFNYENEELLRMIGLAFTFDMEIGISFPGGASVTVKKLVRLVRNVCK